MDSQGMSGGMQARLNNLCNSFAHIRAQDHPKVLDHPAKQLKGTPNSEPQAVQIRTRRKTGS